MDDWQDRWTKADMVDASETLREMADILEDDVRCGRRTKDEAETLLEKCERAADITPERNDMSIKPDTPFSGDLNIIMPPLIHSATQAARRVGSQESQKADRHERVGLFVTNVRRDVGRSISNIAAQQAIITDLCNKAIWHDAGELASQFHFIRNTYCTAEDVKRWVTMARILPIDSEDEQFKRDLDDINDDAADMRALISAVGPIAERAEKAADELEEFMTLLAAS